METNIEEVKKRMEVVMAYYRNSRNSLGNGDMTYCRKIAFQFQPGKDMTSDVLSSFLNKYAGKVSLEWLFFGIGDMLPQKNVTHTDETPKKAIARLLGEIAENVGNL